MLNRSLSALVAPLAVLVLTLLPAPRAAAQTSEGELVRRVHQLEQRVAKLEALLTAGDADAPRAGGEARSAAPAPRDRVAALVSVTPIEPTSAERAAVKQLEGEAEKLEREAADTRDRVSKARLDRAAKAKRVEAIAAAAELERARRWVVAWLGDRYVAFVVHDLDVDMGRFSPGDMITWNGRREAITDTVVEFDEVTTVRATERPSDFVPRPAKAPAPPQRKAR